MRLGDNKALLGLLLLFFLVPQLLNGQHQSIISTSSFNEGEMINSRTIVYQTEDDLTVAEVIQKIDNGLLPVSENRILQGHSNNFFWVLFDITHLQKNTEIKYFLEVANPHIDEILAYKIDFEPRILFKGGDHFPFNQRLQLSNTFIIPLSLDPGVNKFLIKLDKRRSSISFPLKIWTEQGFQRHQLVTSRYYGIFFGFLLLVVITSSFISILLRNRIFGVYALYILLNLIYIFTTAGYSFQYLYPNSIRVNDFFRLLVALINLIVASYYVVLFLNIKKYRPGNITPLILNAGLFLVNLTLWLLFPGFVRENGLFFLNLIYLQIIAVAGVLIISAIQTFRLQRTTVILFFVSFSFSVLGTFAFVALEYGLAPSIFFEINPVGLGIGLEVIVLSVAMTLRLKTIRHDTEELKSENIALKQRSKMLLEQENKQTYFINDVEVATEDIIYIEAQDHYLKFYLINSAQPFLVRKTIKAALAELPTKNFIQTHKSYIVNLAHIKIKYASSIVLRDNLELPLSRTYKDAVRQRIIIS